MADEQIKETQATTEQPVCKEQHKLNIIKKIIACATSVMKAAFSKGDADTVWYKKGLYYTAAIILAGIVYLFTYHGVEVIDWLTALISGLF
jgi:TctA family transporter